MVTFATFKKVMSFLKENGLDCRIYGGFAFDGLRGRVTREHKDIDIYLDADKLARTIVLFEKLGYTPIQKERMYFIKSPDLRVGICLTTREGESIVIHGNYTVVSTPGIMWTDNIKSIDGFTFDCAPNELMVFDSQYCVHEEDKKLATQIQCNADMFKQIKII